MTMRIEVPVALLTIGTFNPAGVAMACERKLATLFASGLELVSSIAVLSVNANEPVFGTTDTGMGMMLIEGV
jgi:hypothetical protein